MYHAQSIEQIFSNLNTSENGLDSTQIHSLTKQYGPNRLSKSGYRAGRFKIFLDQWKSPLIIILIVAGVISGILGDLLDMGIILGTAGINILIGFFQEDKANRALSQLQSMVEYKALVVRDGKKMQISSEELVPGDLLLVSAGDKIQADGRIVSVNKLKIDESALTGESEPVSKITKIIKEQASIGDRINMVFCGTVALDGEAEVVVTATGKNTELGKIAELVKKTDDDETPLQKQLDKLGKVLSVIILVLALGIFVLGLLHDTEGYTFLDMFETAVAVAVAAIPEGLVISLTIILAIGMQHILKKKSLVRKLVAAETLGSVSVICTDKTGTLTEGKMSLTSMVTATDNYDFAKLGKLKFNKFSKDENHDILLAYKIGVFCNNSILQNPDEVEDKWSFVGDTTEVALLKAAVKSGLNRHTLEKDEKRKDELPFSSSAKYMATLHRNTDESFIYIKGAPEIILEKSTKFIENGKVKKLTKEKKEFFKEEIESMTGSGLRVIALAYKEEGVDKEKIFKKDIEDIIFVSLAGLSDPLRPKVSETLEVARRAGIHIVMITGDHAKTAQTIAGRIGLPNKKENVVEGSELDNMSDIDLAKLIKRTTVFARVNPEHKIKIVQAFQMYGEVVAMTGDGVNDAPALKGADIGVALGSGTDVAKETSDLVLLDDSVETIVAAVEEGRTIYQNIKKVVLYLLASSFSEVLLISGSLIAGLPLAVLPAQILWINVIQDSFPNMALAFDKGDKENMFQPPRRSDEPILDKEMKTMIAIISIVSNVLLFSIFLYVLKSTNDISLARTMAFLGLGIAAQVYIYSVRSMRHYFWQINPFGNRYLNFALMFGWMMLVLAIYFPPFQTILRTEPISLEYWGIMVGFGFFNLLLIEIIKFFFIKFNRLKYNKKI